MTTAAGRERSHKLEPIFGNLLVLLFFGVLTALMTYPLVGRIFTAIPGDGFDGWQNYWNLWWVRVSLLEQGASPLFTNLLYHPTGVSLAFQTLNLFNGLTTLPIQSAFGLLPAYNAAAAFSFLAGAYGAYLLACHVLHLLGFRGWSVIGPAVVAGSIFAFSPFHFAHLLGHMQVFSLEWLPFAAWALVRGLARLDHSRSMRQMWRYGLVAAVFLILVGLCDWYYALYMALFTALLGSCRLCARRLNPHHLGMLAIAWGGFLLLLAPLWLPMVHAAAQSSYMVPSEVQARVLSADLLAFITPSELHPLWGKWVAPLTARFTSTTSERTVFAGFVPLALALFASLKSGRRLRFWWISTLAFILAALGPILHIAGRSSFSPAGISIPLPYQLLYRWIPFLDIARSISRFDVMVMLSLSVLSAAGLARLMQKTLLRRTWLWPLTALALICFEFLSAPYPFSAPDTPAYYQELGKEPGDFAVLNLPMNWDRPGYLLYQTVHGKPLTAGYISRDDPNTLVYRAPVLQEYRFLGQDILCDDLARLAPSVLDALDIRYVILDRYKMPGGTEREITDQYTSRIFTSQAPIYEDERLTVYQVESPTSRAPFAILGEGWGERQSEGDRAWREIAGQATLQVVGDEQEIDVLVRANGAAGRLLLSGPNSESASMDLSPDEDEMHLRAVLGPDRNTLTLSVEGAASARVGALYVYPIVRGQ